MTSATFGINALRHSFGVEKFEINWTTNEVEHVMYYTNFNAELVQVVRRSKVGSGWFWTVSDKVVGGVDKATEMVEAWKRTQGNATSSPKGWHLC